MIFLISAYESYFSRFRCAQLCTVAEEGLTMMLFAVSEAAGASTLKSDEAKRLSTTCVGEATTAEPDSASIAAAAFDSRTDWTTPGLARGASERAHHARWMRKTAGREVNYSRYRGARRVN